VLTLAASCAVIYPRRINAKPGMPGSFVHARFMPSTQSLLDAFGVASAEYLTAEQLRALAGTAHRKWTAVRWMLAPAVSTVLVLFAALIVA